MLRRAMCEQYGYPKITAAARRKILTENAARVYGIDVDALAAAAASDDLSWTARAAREMERQVGGGTTSA